MNNRVANACYRMYNVMAPTVREKADAFETDQMIFGTRTADSTAVTMYNNIVVRLQKKLNAKNRDVMVSGDPFAPVRRYLTKYSVKTAQDQFAAWTKLEELLLVKYIDGNVKPQDADGNFKHSEHSKGIPAKVEWPGYTDIWKEAVAREHGEIIEVREAK